MQVGSRDSRRVWVISELYYPEETSTGYFLTQIAEGLARNHPVHVLCGQPTYSSRGTVAPWHELRRRVDIHRCWGTRWNKDRLTLRLVNLLTLSITIFLRALWSFQRADRVLVVTNPPLLPFMIAAACRIRGAQCLLLIHDVYPDVAVATGLLRPHSLPTRGVEACFRRLYRTVQSIVVLGRDMENLVRRKLGAECPQISLIPNWGDIEFVRPTHKSSNHLLSELGLENRFVIQFSGNMGRSHDVESILAAAAVLGPYVPIHFLVVGSGAKKQRFDQQLAASSLTNVTALPHQPRHELRDLLNAGDVALIAFIPGMLGVSVPSRMYNVMAAGKPIIAMTEENSELALVVREERIGWVVPPGDAKALAEAVTAAWKNPLALAAMGRRARSAAERLYSLNQVLDAYERLIRGAPQSPSVSTSTITLKRTA